MAYLDNNGVLYLWGKIKAHVSSAVAGLYTKPSGGIPASDLAAGVIPAVPSASTTTPKMDGTAAVGSETAFARGDHVHPSDTSKVDTSTFNATVQSVQTALDNFGSSITNIMDNYAKKTDIASMYKYKGSVATVSDLPSVGVDAGWVYNVEASGMNYAWDGLEWDALGETFSITAITNAEIDTICT